MLSLLLNYVLSHRRKDNFLILTLVFSPQTSAQYLVLFMALLGPCGAATLGLFMSPYLHLEPTGASHGGCTQAYLLSTPLAAPSGTMCSYSPNSINGPKLSTPGPSLTVLRYVPLHSSRSA